MKSLLKSPMSNISTPFVLPFCANYSMPGLRTENKNPARNIFLVPLVLIYSLQTLFKNHLSF